MASICLGLNVLTAFVQHIIDSKHLSKALRVNKRVKFFKIKLLLNVLFQSAHLIPVFTIWSVKTFESVVIFIYSSQLKGPCWKQHTLLV